MRFIVTLLLMLAPLQGLHAADVHILPVAITLTGPKASHRLLVVRMDGDKVTADATDGCQFKSNNTGVARVDAIGVIEAVANGETTITASRDGMEATVTVIVTGTDDKTPPSFVNDVIPVLTRIGCNSGACHGALAGKGGFKLSLRGYDPEADHFALTRQALGRRVDGMEAAQSLFLKKPTGQMKHGGGRKLDIGSPDYELLVRWVGMGAPGPKPKEAVVERIETIPVAVTLKPEDKLQVIVRAWYTDGRSADVTRWAKFSSTDDLVAGVDDFGKVTVKGNGEATINAIFANRVANTLVSSPYPNPPPTIKESADSGLAQIIDRLVNNKLAQLRLFASPLCTDQEFIRRVYLDAAGILPTVKETEQFVQDTTPDKRQWLIDKLLKRPEFIDYWTYKWCDLLLVSTRKLPQQGVWAFYQFVRQSVAENKPWDQFAHAILTARGSTLQNGAANYFVLHKDVSELTEATSVTFMGMSITCCRCHNHPLEKWTQDQYWSFANLFSRVGIKNGERGGEFFVQPQPEGEALHLRRGIAMPPTPLDGQAMAWESTADRRAYFANWLTAPANPYFAKAIVNRVWHNYLGRGLVEAEDDLRQTNPPSNPELLDALVNDFKAHHQDVRHLMHGIMNSVTYQRSSKPLAENAADDRFYSHYLIRRLPAEVVLDAYAQVTGVPTPFNAVNVGSSGGTAGTNNYPLGTRALQLPDTLVVSQFLDAFGRPERGQTCSCERQQDSSVTQALHLNNGQTLNDKLRAKDNVIDQWLKESITARDAIRRVFLLGLTREPLPEELAKFEALLKQAEQQGASRRDGMEDVFWAVLTGKEFLFNH